MAHFMSWSIFMGLGFMFGVAGIFVTLGGFQLARRVEVEEEAIERMAAAIPTRPLAVPSGAAE